MSKQKANQSIDNLGRAMDRLREALDEPPTNNLLIDGTIQRFEFVIELFWKTFKRILALSGITAHTPRECLKHAYKARWIDDQQLWLDMLRARNQTSHIYNEDAARHIYGDIQDFFPELERTYRFLAKKYEDICKEDSEIYGSDRKQ